MIKLVRTYPVLDGYQRRHIIKRSMIWAVFGSFLIVATLAMAGQVLDGFSASGNLTNFVVFTMPLIAWLYGSFIWLPMLGITCLLSGLLLRKGFSGFCITISVAAFLGTVVAIVFTGSPIGLKLGAQMGLLFGVLYWIGGWRADRSVLT